MARERKFSKKELYQTTRKLLLDHGYDGYTFTLLANQLEVSRAAIYKYYENKEELLIEYMVFELDAFSHHLKEISIKNTFMEQFHALFEIIFNDMSIYKIREIGMHIPTVNDKVAASKRKLEKLHVELYDSLQDFIKLGKAEEILKEDIPSNLVLGMIFQTVNIPNTTGVPHHEWVSTLKEIICHGMFRNSN